MVLLYQSSINSPQFPSLPPATSKCPDPGKQNTVSSESEGCTKTHRETLKYEHEEEVPIQNANQTLDQLQHMPEIKVDAKSSQIKLVYPNRPDLYIQSERSSFILIDQQCSRESETKYWLGLNINALSS